MNDESTFDDFIGVFPGLASPDFCEQVIAEFTRIQTDTPSANRPSEASYGGSHNRRDDCLFLDQTNKDVATALNACLQEALGACRKTG